MSATIYLNSLVNAGLLADIKAGRDRLFVNPTLLALLTTDEDEP